MLKGIGFNYKYICLLICLYRYLLKLLWSSSSSDVTPVSDDDMEAWGTRIRGSGGGMSGVSDASKSDVSAA